MRKSIRSWGGPKTNSPRREKRERGGGAAAGDGRTLDRGREASLVSSAGDSNGHEAAAGESSRHEAAAAADGSCIGGEKILRGAMLAQPSPAPSSAVDQPSTDLWRCLYPCQQQLKPSSHSSLLVAGSPSPAPSLLTAGLPQFSKVLGHVDGETLAPCNLLGPFLYLATTSLTKKEQVIMKEQASKQGHQYSIPRCLEVLNAMDDVSDDIKVLASDVFKDEINRELFLCHDSKLRGLWLKKEVVKLGVQLPP